MHAWITQSRAAVIPPTAAAPASVVEGAAEAVPNLPEVPTPAAIVDSDKFWASQPPESTFAMDLAAKRAWRISPELLQSARAFVKEYEGSHNFYNYTVGKDFRDSTARRVMRKLEVSSISGLDSDESQVLTCLIGLASDQRSLHCQWNRICRRSFPWAIFHASSNCKFSCLMSTNFVDSDLNFAPCQRKMIGLAVLAIRTATPPSLVPETYGPSRIHVPKAPGLGLLLLEPQYVEYNKRVEESNKKLTELKEQNRIADKELADQIRDHVTTLPCSEQVDTFKMEHIYKRMWEVEHEESQ